MRIHGFVENKKWDLLRGLETVAVLESGSSASQVGDTHLFYQYEWHWLSRREWNDNEIHFELYFSQSFLSWDNFKLIFSVLYPYLQRLCIHLQKKYPRYYNIQQIFERKQMSLIYLIWKSRSYRALLTFGQVKYLGITSLRGISESLATSPSPTWRLMIFKCFHWFTFNIAN